MKNIFHISFRLYRICLVLSLLLYVVSKFFVGFAGHSGTNNSEYIILGYVVIAILTFILFESISRTRVLLRNVLRYFGIAIILIGTIFLLTELYDSFTLYQTNNYGEGEIIPDLMIVFFIGLNLVVLIGLIKDKL